MTLSSSAVTGGPPHSHSHPAHTHKGGWNVCISSDLSQTGTKLNLRPSTTPSALVSQPPGNVWTQRSHCRNWERMCLKGSDGPSSGTSSSFDSGCQVGHLVSQVMFLLSLDHKNRHHLVEDTSHHLRMYLSDTTANPAWDRVRFFSPRWPR